MHPSGVPKDPKNAYRIKVKMYDFTTVIQRKFCYIVTKILQLKSWNYGHDKMNITWKISKE